jgi:hypothetical protein
MNREPLRRDRLRRVLDLVDLTFLDATYQGCSCQTAQENSLLE